MLEGLSRRFSSFFQSLGGRSVVSEADRESALEEIKGILIDADMNVRAVRRFINQLSERFQSLTPLEGVSARDQIFSSVHDQIVSFLSSDNQKLLLKGPDGLSSLLLTGLQGAGKTTTASKLARYLKEQGRKVLLVAADYQRAGAVEQLQALAQSLEVPFYTSPSKSSEKAAKEALHEAKKRLIDTIIFDVAGRLDDDSALMDELQKVQKILSPVETLLVVDAMSGQSAYESVKSYLSKIELTGFVLTKLDSDAKGGVALSLRSLTSLPIKFAGTGEKSSDFGPFYPDRIASHIVGMGDLQTLVEKAQKVSDEKEDARLAKKVKKSRFSFEDYLSQIQRVKKMGGVAAVAKLLPGAQGGAPAGQAELLKREEAIILSMTKEERRNARIIGQSRQKRIAHGSGVRVFDVRSLLKKFEKTKIMMKKVMNNKKAQQELAGKLGLSGVKKGGLG